LKDSNIKELIIKTLDYLFSIIEHITYLFVISSIIIFLAVFDEKILTLLLDYTFLYILIFQIIKNLYFSIKTLILSKKINIQYYIFIYSILYIIYYNIVTVHFEFKEYFLTFLLISRFFIYFIYLFLNKSNIKDYFAVIKLNPYQSFTLSFIFIILLGSLLLKLPFSSKDITFIDALFTSASAVCVTGLNVVDTSSSFTIIGQIIILVLIQIGALGIMTFTSFLAILSGSITSSFDRFKSEEIFAESSFQKLKRLIKFIVVSTFFIEASGAIIIFFSVYNINIDNKVFFSIFHSISAFANAGFSTLPNGLVGLYNVLPLNLIIMILIIIGGIGFPVVLNIIEKIKIKVKLSINTKIVLITTLSLIIIGAIGFYIFENKRLAFNTQEKVLISFFQSVTSRTAGFNTIDTSNLSIPTYLLLIFLMFIGASPSSTGGGLKTTVFFILLFATISTIRKRETLYIFKKKISNSYFQTAGIFLFVRVFILFISIMFLIEFEKSFNIIQITFEAVSALSTVGLSTGITPNLSTNSKIVIILLMLIGRIGPIKFFSSFTKIENQNKVKPRIEYLQENIILD